MCWLPAGIPRQPCCTGSIPRFQQAGLPLSMAPPPFVLGIFPPPPHGSANTMKANDMRLAFRNFVISLFMKLSLRFFGFSIAPQPNLLAAALSFFISLCGKIMTFCPRGIGQKLTKYGMKNNMFCFVRCFWGADFRIRKPARAYTWQMLVHARKRNLFSDGKS